jgi:hypothetical protein
MRRTTRVRRSRALLLALLATVGAILAVAAPVGAEQLRPGCAPSGGLFSGAQHPGACWRPFSASSPFNVRLRPNDPRTVSNSSRIVARLNAFGKPLPLEFGAGKNREGRGTKAVYFSTATDPVYTVRFAADSRNGGTWGRHPVNGMRVHIPDGARPAMETDRHMVIIDQQQGASYELWQVRNDVLHHGGTITATWGGRVEMNGDGRLAPDMGTASASGLSIAGGILRPEELLDGDIPHALYLSANCSNGTSVYPSTNAPDDGEKDCAGAHAGPNANAPALGQRFQLTYTDKQIAGMNIPAHAKVLLRALAHYGLIMMDTTPDPWHIDQESAMDRMALGHPDPGIAFARTAKLPHWDDGDRYLWALDQIPGLDGHPGSWTKDLQVVQPCVSAGTCALSGTADKHSTTSRRHARKKAHARARRYVAAPR